MTDYSLGRAHGEISIDYDSSGADRAAKGLDEVAASSTAADASLSKTEKTLKDTDKQLGSTGGSADGLTEKLHGVRESSDDAEGATRKLNTTLRDSEKAVGDVDGAYRDLEGTRTRQTKVIKDESNAHSGLLGVLGGLSNLLPSLSGSFDKLGTVQDGAAGKAGGLAKSLGMAAAAAKLLGPEAAGAAEAIEGVSGAASAASGAVTGFIKNIAGLELAVGKVSGIALGGGALGGLAGLGGAAGVQGIVEMASAARQLSGVLGLLPAVISGVEVVTGTLQVAFHGVDSALQDMFANDPKKFLQDIANMGPTAAQSMLQVAQFRNQFLAGGAAVQDSFFSKIAADIAPLIQTWLPALVSAGSKIAGVLGDAADGFAHLLEQPQAMAAFSTFISNVSAGLQALQPAISPLLDIFTQLTTVGSSFFKEIGGDLTGALSTFADMIDQAASSGKLQQWIQTGINAFERLGNIIFNAADAFNNIMNIADKFGGGGLLGWLQQVSEELAKWTESAGGQKALTDFFTTLRKATDAFTPMLTPLLDGLVSLGKSFVGLGVGIAPGFLAFFNGFASAMAQLGPHIADIAPSINQFLTDLAATMIRIVQQVGPQLPEIFAALSNAFVNLLPQLPHLVEIFTQLIEQVGPQLPKLFDAVTQAIITLVPLMPTIIGFIRDFVSIITQLVNLGTAVEKTFQQFIDGILKFGNGLIDTLQGKGIDAGKSLVQGLITGMLDSVGLGGLDGAAKSLVDTIAKWLQSSPAKVGPFSGSGYTLVRGRKMVTDMAAGMVSAQGAVSSAAASTAMAASSALGVGGGTAGSAGGGAGAPAPGGAGSVGGALLPPWIAGADDSVLSAYLKHQFSDTNGLKGLAKSLGTLLQGFQSGFNLASQSVAGPLFQALGMVPGLNQRGWSKMTPEQTAQAQQKTAAKQGPSWADVLGGPSTTPGTDFPWDAVAKAESSGNWQNADTGNNGHFGGLQFSPDTWKAFGGLDFAPRPDQATREQQIEIANRTAFDGYNGTQPQGLGAWETITKGMVPGVTVNTPRGGPIGPVKGPSWQQLTTGVATPVGPVYGPPMPPPPGLDSVGAHGAPGAGTAAAAAAPAGIAGVSPTGRPIYSGPHTSDTGGAVVPNVAAAEAIVKQLFPGVSVNNDYRPKDGYNEHSSGEAIDFSINPGGKMGVTTPEGQALGAQLKDFLVANAKTLGLQYGLWDQTQWNPDGSSSPMDNRGSVTENHGDHFHGRFNPGPASASLFDANGQPVALAGNLPPGAAAATAGAGGLILPSGQPLNALLDNTGKTATASDQLLQSYLQGNPALAGQIDAAKTPGASDQAVMGALNGIDTTITGLKAQDATGNKSTIDALQSQQSQIAQGAGFQQNQQSPVSAVSGAIGSAGNAVGSVIQAISSGLDSLTATQDIADHLVYGLRNTADIGKIVDDFQKYITFAANIANATGQILSTVGSIMSAAGSSPTGGDPGAGVSAAGQIASLVSGALTAVNAAIDFSQQIAQIAGTYVGRMLSQLTAGLGGTPLMGDVRMLLNKNTGQLLTYSEDNPGNQNALTVPGFLNQTYDYGGGQNPNPAINAQYNIYAGPGQSPGEMLNEVNWMVNTAGTTGAMSPANF